VNDVKEICELALDVPAPPLREADAALALARRTNRRRWAGLGAATVVATGAVLAAPLLLAPQANPVAVVPAAPTGPVPPAPLPAVPAWQRAQAHGPRVVDVLTAALPPGYTAVPQFPSDSGPAATWLRQPDSGQYGTLTSLVVSAGGGQGLVEAFTVRDDVPAPAGDLCAAADSARFDAFFGAADTCRTVTVDGVPVRVTTRTDPDIGPVVIAARMLDGGFLGVEASAGRWTYQADGALPPDAKHRPAPGTVPAPPRLAAPALTADQAAALAADPDLLP